MNRILWIDILKGVGIILVAVGHNPWLLKMLSKYIYWFHMPIFFILSGFLFNGKYDFASWTKRRFTHILVPYFMFVLVYIVAVKLIVSIGIINTSTWGVPERIAPAINLAPTFESFYSFITEGHRWWFITTLFFAQIFGYLTLKLHNRVIIALLASIFYLLAFVDSIYLREIRFPFFMDSALMATVFYILGYALAQINFNKSKTKIFSNFHFFTALIIFIIVVMLDIFHIIDHEFHIKHTKFGIPLLNIIVPCCMFIVLCHFSQWLAQFKIIATPLASLGQASIIIYFLHRDIDRLGIIALMKIDVIPSTEFLWSHQHIVGPVIFCVTISISYIAYVLLKQLYITRVLFLGERKRSQ